MTADPITFESSTAPTLELERLHELEDVRNIRRSLELEDDEDPERENVRNIRRTPQLEDELDDDPEDDLEEINPFENLRELRGSTSSLAEWSRQLLDLTLEVRLRVATGKLDELDTSLEAVRTHLELAPKVGR